MLRWTFDDPLWLLGLLALAVVALLRYWRRVPVFVVPHAMEWRRTTFAVRPAWPLWCAYVGLALIFLAMARPQILELRERDKQPGYDIILAIDLSTSMYAEDFNRNGVTMNRLLAIKPVIEAFINQRPHDRIGVVAFAGRAHTFAPLTFDHDWLRRQTSRLSIGLIEDGTAIGDAIGVSLARLRQGQRNAVGEPRVGAFIVVLTDGASNRGSLDPRMSAELAKDEGVVIFTIGAGAEGQVPMPVYDYAGNRVGTEMRTSEVDNLVLRDIADATGGYFFRATDTTAVNQAFVGIDQATKVEFSAPPLQITHELFAWLAGASALCLAGAVLGTAAWAQKENFA